MDPFTLSIGMGLVVALVFAEILGLAAGGMVVPGYLALFLNSPLAVVLTLLAALATWGLVGLVSRFAIIYGRRRTALMILVGFVVGASLNYVWSTMLIDLQLTENVHLASISVIGFLVPGLIAIWYDRQGPVQTTSVLMLAAVVVRLLLITCGYELQV